MLVRHVHWRALTAPLAAFGPHRRFGARIYGRASKPARADWLGRLGPRGLKRGPREDAGGRAASGLIGSIGACAAPPRGLGQRTLGAGRAALSRHGGGGGRTCCAQTGWRVRMLGVLYCREGQWGQRPGSSGAGAGGLDGAAVRNRTGLVRSAAVGRSVAVLCKDDQFLLRREMRAGLLQLVAQW